MTVVAQYKIQLLTFQVFTQYFKTHQSYQFSFLRKCCFCCPVCLNMNMNYRHFLFASKNKSPTIYLNTTVNSSIRTYFLTEMTDVRRLSAIHF